MPKKRIIVSVALLLVLGAILILSLCLSPDAVENSMVQVWAAEGDSAPLAYGLAVGDGSRIITALNFEHDIPDELWVGVPGKTKYRASIKAIDPQTSATLLEVEGGKFPTDYTIAEPGSLSAGADITVMGWDAAGFNKIKTKNTIYNGFTVAIAFSDPLIVFPGALVMNSKGKVAGIISEYYQAFLIRLGPIGQTSPVIEIHDALKLLLPDAAGRPWETTPVYALVTTIESLTGLADSAPPASKYIEMAEAIDILLNTMGEPLTADELPDDYRFISWGGPDTADGTLLTVVYPRPVELKNTSGEVLAEARWVGVQWGRSEGKSDRIFYGRFEDGRAIVDGGFYLTGDTSGLESAIQ
jgi:hypothetical protein